MTFEYSLTLTISTYFLLDNTVAVFMKADMDNDIWDPEEHENDLNYSKAGVTVEEDEVIFKYYNKWAR